MRILQHKQGSPEWIASRLGIPTASEFAPFMIEQPKCRLTKAELHALLNELGIEFKKSALNEDLIALLPDVAPYLSLTESTQSARTKYICEKLTDAMENDEFEQEAYDKDQRFLDNDPWIKRGKFLEPFAREALSKKLNREIAVTGLILHDCEKFAASPDGLVLSEDGENYEMGAEIKCEKRDIHLREKLAGVLPDKHRFQVHGGMVVTGLRKWHYFAWHPKLPPLHVVVEWDDFTQQVHDGLLAFVDEMEAVRVKLSQMWREEFQNAEGDARREDASNSDGE